MGRSKSRVSLVFSRFGNAGLRPQWFIHGHIRLTVNYTLHGASDEWVFENSLGVRVRISAEDAVLIYDSVSKHGLYSSVGGMGLWVGGSHYDI